MSHAFASIGDASATAVSCKVQGITVEQLIISDGCGLIRESGHDMETRSIHIGVLGICCRPVEGSRTEAIELL